MFRLCCFWWWWRCGRLSWLLFRSRCIDRRRLFDSSRLAQPCHERGLRHVRDPSWQAWQASLLSDRGRSRCGGGGLCGRSLGQVGRAQETAGLPGQHASQAKLHLRARPSSRSSVTATVAYHSLRWVTALPSPSSTYSTRMSCHVGEAIGYSILTYKQRQPCALQPELDRFPPVQS